MVESEAVALAHLGVQGGRFCWYPPPVVLVLSGPSGAGKDAIIKQFLREDPSFHFVVTATSRAPRPGEVDGVDYHFLAPDEFERLLAQGQFLEHAVVYGQHKGVPRWELERALAAGRNVIMRVDVQGARTLRRVLEGAVYVFVLAESREELMCRLEERGSDQEEALARRSAEVGAELEALPEFDYLLLNRRGELSEAVRRLHCIVEAERCRINRPAPRICLPEQGGEPASAAPEREEAQQ